MISRMTLVSILAVALSTICVDSPAFGHPDDIYWEPGPGTLNDGGRINTMIRDHFHDLLIVAGSFSSIDGIPAANIAAWDGTSWSALGEGTDGPVNAITIWSGLVFAGGEFSTAGSAPANNIAFWDGAAWYPLGDGVEVVTALEDWDGKIYAAHLDPDYKGISYLSAWDFASWTDIGYFMLENFSTFYPRSCVKDLQIYGQRLNAAGYFIKASCSHLFYPDAADALGIAAWDGTTWSAHGQGYRYSEAAAWHEGNLVVAGWNDIDVWDGTTWTELWELGPVYCDDYFRAVMIYNGNIVASGDICSFDYELHNWIMEWDGSEWSQLGSGFDAPAPALCVYDGKLIAGGSFTIAGGKACAGLATWNPQATEVMITAFHASPVEDGVELTWSLGSGERIEGFRIYRVGKDGDEILLNKELIAPGIRSYTDETALPGERYLYTLAILGAESGEVRSFSVDAGLPPVALHLSQNHPNPFNPSTSISYTVPAPARVTLRIYSPSGHLVRTLVDCLEQPGVRETVWDGTNDAGLPTASGVYFYRLTAGKETLTKKMLLLR